MLQSPPVTSESPKIDMSTLLALHADFAFIGSAQINIVSFHPFFAYLSAHRSTIRTSFLSVDLVTLPWRQASVLFYSAIVNHEHTPLAGVLCYSTQLGWSLGVKLSVRGGWGLSLTMRGQHAHPQYASPLHQPFPYVGRRQAARWGVEWKCR